MPITVAQLNRLQNFKKYQCEQCSCEYFSSRPSKFCSPVCKQASYRERLNNEETRKRVEIIGFKNMESNKPSLLPKSYEDDSAKILLLAAEKRLNNIIKK